MNYNYLTKQEAEKKYEVGHEEAIVLKFYKSGKGDLIGLYRAAPGDIIRDAYLVHNGGYYIYTVMYGYETLEELETDKLHEACAAFNTILQTINA